MLGKKIVVVSDDWTVTDLWSQNMKGNGVAVDLIGFGALGSWIETMHGYALAVVDINDSDEVGAEICRSLRDASDTPVLVLTYDRDERTQLMLYKSGADECIVKPIGMPLLLAKVRAWLQRVDVNSNGVAHRRSVGARLKSGVSTVN